MTPEEKYNEEIWSVLQKIKINILRTKRGIPLVKYEIDDTNKLEDILIAKLESEELIKIVKEPLEYLLAFERRLMNTHNAVSTIPNVNLLDYTQSSDTIFLEILPKFDEIYKKSSITRLKKNESILPNKKDLRKKLTAVIKYTKFGKKEKAFLKFLANDFTPKTTKEVGDEIPTTAYKNIKLIVKKKINGTGFFIKTDKGNLYHKPTYQLKFLPTLENV